MMANLSADSLTDTQKARIEERPSETGGKLVAVQDDASKAVSQNYKRPAEALTANGADQDNNEEVAQPQRSESVEVPAKKAKAAGSENDTPQPSQGASKSAEPAASAAPFTGGFGGLASKGASGFAFGGTSTFGSGAFSSVAFGGTVFGGTPAASHASKASKDGGGDRASPSVASNAGSAAAAALGGGVFASSADANNNATDHANQVFATAGTSGAAEPRERCVTGEEEEQTVFSCKASLYHFDRAGAKPAWRERGVGALRVNLLPGGRSRLVMRAAGILRLLLNAWLYPEITLKCQEGLPQVSFSCVNAAAADRGGGADAGAERGAAPQIEMFSLKFASMEKLRQFVNTVERHKVPQRQADAVTEDACAAVDAIASSIV